MTAVPRWCDEILAYWFDQVGPGGWFTRSDAVDAEIRSRFLASWERVTAAFELEALLQQPASALAALILLDQFPRNMFRASARAFASDGHALTLAQAVVDRRLDAAIRIERRLFCYMPFEHSERLEDQRRSVDLIARLGIDHYTMFAEVHRDIIARFGRFPHRNQVLGRISTPEELAFLQQPESGF